MLGKIVRIIFVILIFIGVLYIGGYSVDQFKHEIKFKNPKDVLGPYVPDVNLPDVPDVETPDISDNSNKSNNSKKDEITTSEIDLTGSKKSGMIELSYTRSIKVKINGQEYELSSTNTISFLKWLANTYTDGAEVAYEVDEDETTEKETKKSNNEEIEYADVLENEEDLDLLVDSIETVKSLEDLDDYDRTEYEKPVKSYKLDGKTYNRNDYSWLTSDFLISREPFEYICPYTGITVTDDSKLDYDHIVSLKVVERSCPDWWGEEERNMYAYDQAVGVDVYYSANRSKSDKTPSEWLPEENVEDYCYTYLLICSKYDLKMSEEDIKTCYNEIIHAFEIGETVSALNQYICE